MPFAARGITGVRVGAGFLGVFETLTDGVSCCVMVGVDDGMTVAFLCIITGC